MSEEDRRRAVLDELDVDPSRAAGDIGVAVAGGVMTPAGQVGGYAEKVAAERAAWSVPGVRRRGPDRPAADRSADSHGDAL